MSEMQTVLLIGATGRTGSVIVDALLDNPLFNVVAAVRSESANKPVLQGFQKRGLTIRICDTESASPEQLQEVLQGADIVVSCVIPFEAGPQKRLVDACKAVGVKRFVPSHWGTACVPGVMMLHDTKLEIANYVKECGVPYTLIDVGWWMHEAFPILGSKTSDVDSAQITEMKLKYFNQLYVSGDVPFAVTDMLDIGKFVECILSDSRTINRYVFIWAEETTQNHTLALARQTTGLEIERVPVSQDEVESRLSIAKKSGDWLELVAMQYALSLWVRGDNTIENAKKQEYGSALDARELYPSVPFRKVEDYVKDLYAELK